MNDTPKTIINAEEVRALKDRLREINRLPFADIEWHEGGKPITTHPDVVAEWRFVCMNNADFIDTDFYKETPESLAEQTEVINDSNV